MRPFGTTHPLARRRRRALRLLRQGKDSKFVAQKVGTTERSVRRWQQQAQAPKTQSARRRSGRLARLVPAQVSTYRDFEARRPDPRLCGRLLDPGTDCSLDLAVIRRAVQAQWRLASAATHRVELSETPTPLVRGR